MSFFLTLSLTLRILVSLLLTLNKFQIFRDVKNAEMRAFYRKKERKVSLTDCKLKYFSSRCFLGIRSLDFSEFQDGAGNPCEVVCDRARLFGKTFFASEIGEIGQK